MSIDKLRKLARDRGITYAGALRKLDIANQLRAQDATRQVEANTDKEVTS